VIARVIALHDIAAVEVARIAEHVPPETSASGRTPTSAFIDRFDTDSTNQNPLRNFEHHLAYATRVSRPS